MCMWTCVCPCTVYTCTCVLLCWCCRHIIWRLHDDVMCSRTRPLEVSTYGTTPLNCTATDDASILLSYGIQSERNYRFQACWRAYDQNTHQHSSTTSETEPQQVRGGYTCCVTGCYTPTRRVTTSFASRVATYSLPLRFLPEMIAPFTRASAWVPLRRIRCDHGRLAALNHNSTAANLLHTW